VCVAVGLVGGYFDARLNGASACVLNRCVALFVGRLLRGVLCTNPRGQLPPPAAALYIPSIYSWFAVYAESSPPPRLRCAAAIEILYQNAKVLLITRSQMQNWQIFPPKCVFDNIRLIFGRNLFLTDYF